MAFAIADIWSALKPLVKILVLAGLAIHLNLNAKTSVAIPIHRDIKMFDFRRRVIEPFLFWQSLAVECSSKYFDIIVGPRVSSAIRWAPAIQKCTQRTQTLARLGLVWATAIRVLPPLTRRSDRFPPR